MGKAIRWTASLQQNLGRQAQKILRQRAGCRRVTDFGIDKSRSIRDTGTDCGGPCGQYQAAGTPRQQSEFLSERSGAVGGRKCGVTIAAKLKANTEVVERMREAIWMLECFGERGSRRARTAYLCLLAVTKFLQPYGAAHLRANSRIVTTEGLRKVTVAGHVIGFDTNAALLQGRCDVATEQCR